MDFVVVMVNDEFCNVFFGVFINIFNMMVVFFFLDKGFCVLMDVFNFVGVSLDFCWVKIDEFMVERIQNNFCERLCSVFNFDCFVDCMIKDNVVQFGVVVGIKCFVVVIVMVGFLVQVNDLYVGSGNIISFFYICFFYCLELLGLIFLLGMYFIDVFKLVFCKDMVVGGQGLWYMIEVY